MKKIASILLVAVLVTMCLAANVFAAEEPRIVVSNVTAAAGEEVRVLVSMENVADVLPTNGLVYVTYDETGLELVDIDCETETTWKGMVMANVEEGKVSFVNPNQQKKDCVLFEIVLKVKDGVAGEFNVGITVDYILNDAEEQLTFEVVAGVVTVACDCETLTAVEEVPADCVNDGVKAHDKCEACGKLYIDGEEVTEDALVIPALGHTEGEPVKENEVAHTCTEDGSYDEVVYCSVCEEELSRETVVVPAAHTPAEPVRENEVAPTCTEDGSYEEVVYCSICDEELSRVTVVVPAGHVDANNDGVCDVCGNEMPVPDTGDAIYVAVAAALVSMMSVVALTKKREF